MRTSSYLNSMHFKNNELANFEYFKVFGKEDGIPLEQYVKAWLQFHTFKQWQGTKCRRPHCWFCSKHYNVLNRIEMLPLAFYSLSLLVWNCNHILPKLFLRLPLFTYGNYFTDFGAYLVKMTFDDDLGNYHQAIIIPLLIKDEKRFSKIFFNLNTVVKMYTTQKKFRISCAYFFVLLTSNSCRLWRGWQIKVQFPAWPSPISVKSNSF